MSDRLATLLEYLEESPGDAFLLFAIAQEHLRKENDVEAKRYFLQLKQEHPEYVGLYYHLGLLELKHGDALSARNTFPTRRRLRFPAVAKSRS